MDVEMMAQKLVNHQALASEAIRVVLERTNLGGLVNSPDFELSEALDVLADELFSSVLEKTLVANEALEIFLTGLRRKMLSAEVEQEQYVRPVALQCWNNQFVWQVTEEERLKLGTLSADHPMRACYESSFLVPPYLRVRFVEEPAREAELRQGLTRLCSDEGIPSEVAMHYGRFPYPRYFGIQPPARVSLAVALRQSFPWADFRVSDEPLVLVAGCGTGQHPLRAALRYQTKVTALDLSGASLAYGVRLAEELGIGNVRFVEGDLLRAKELGQEFDLVESCGVLHHMADPLAGLKALCDVLKPGGAIRLGLYSRAARECVAQARKLASDEGFPPERLGDFRRRLMELPARHPARPVTGYVDFYSRSGCLDLLFHPLEHNFTLPQIETLLEQAGLEFLGFDSPGAGVQQAYSRLFPSDTRQQNFTFWASFEKMYPRTFRSMYQFWCYKKTP